MYLGKYLMEKKNCIISGSPSGIIISFSNISRFIFFIYNSERSSSEDVVGGVAEVGDGPSPPGNFTLLFFVFFSKFPFLFLLSPFKFYSFCFKLFL